MSKVELVGEALGAKESELTTDGLDVLAIIVVGESELTTDGLDVLAIIVVGGSELTTDGLVVLGSKFGVEVGLALGPQVEIIVGEATG